jgi:hypothetical protein
MSEMTNEMNSSFNAKYESIAIEAASQTIKLSGRGHVEETEDDLRDRDGTTNCATLYPTLYQRQPRRSCPAAMPKSTASVSTPDFSRRSTWEPTARR